MIEQEMSHLEIISEGHTATIYRDGNRVLKFYPNAPPGEVEHEARFQRFAAGAGLPVPAIHGVHTWDNGASALEMAYVNRQQLGITTKNSTRSATKWSDFSGDISVFAVFAPVMTSSM